MDAGLVVAYAALGFSIVAAGTMICGTVVTSSACCESLNNRRRLGAKPTPFDRLNRQLLDPNRVTLAHSYKLNYSVSD
jgi:hypothetical protein